MRRKYYSYRDDPDVPDFPDERPVIVFDGHCMFCSGWVKFVLKHDRRRRYRFVAAQTPLGDALYRHYGLDTRDYETNLLIEGGRAYFKSEGTIRMAAGLGMPWSLVRVLNIIPRFILDPVYEFVARNRFRIAGRRESCYVPTAEERSRFLSSGAGDQSPAMPKSSASSAFR
jgi:predicted DCC family thiol-disulfide oxidoreductase YuxK